MDNEEIKQASQEAWQQVLAHPESNLKSYIEGLGISFSGSKKPVADFCPICRGKKKFGLLPGDDGTWGFKCFGKDCPAGESGFGLQKFLELYQGCDWKQARAAMHALTGIPDPWDEHLDKLRRERATNKKTAPARRDEDEDDDIPLDNDDDGDTTEPPAGDDEEPAPEFIHIPDLGRNVYEEAWARLTLTATHRREIRTKRGLPDAWIDALGFKSAIRANRDALEPLLAMFPPNELLRAGIAVRKRGEWKTLKIADQLCGVSWEKDEETGEFKADNTERIIIPYIDAHGRIVGLRPHKRGLSNGAFREDEASAFYEKNHSNLSLIYGEHFLTERPEEHAHRAIICEGEFKADGLGYCGIPSIGFQGISFLRNNHQTGQAVNALVSMLRAHKIREVVIAFDAEDKDNKPVKKPKDRFIAEIHARHTAIVLENHGFKAYICILPESWMEGGGEQPGGWHTKGKADWDGRLAHHLRRAKGDHRKARASAAAEFNKLLSTRGGKNPPVFPVPRQFDAFPTFKEDVIIQELNRLLFEPECFVGGRHEIETAAEITGHCHPRYRDILSADTLAQALRQTYGGYYVVKQPSEKFALRVIKAKQEIVQQLDSGHTLPDGDDVTAPLTEDDIRGLRAALLACNITLYKLPKPFTNFTITSRYKVLVTEPDGSTRKDRLCVFTDQHGRRSKPVQINWEKMSSSQEARKIFLKLDGNHFKGGQNEIDAMVPTIDVNNYQKTIVEIDTYGYDKDSGIYLMGDCAVVDNPDKPFLFPDNNGIIWHNGMGYKNAESLATFGHKPPLLFPGEGKTRDIHDAIDWNEERKQVNAIWNEALAIAYKSFGDFNGFIMIAGLLQYIAHPETLEQIPGKPGLWVQGSKGSGKTQTIMAFMRMLGYIRDYGPKGLSGTKVGIERCLSQFDCLPFHIDEWRNIRASDDLVAFVTNAFNGLAIPKGAAVSGKAVRLSRAATMPVVTGEDMTTDAALLSRYIRLTMSKSSRSGTDEEQRANFARMLELSSEFHRIGRFIMRQRKHFSDSVITLTRQFIANPEVLSKINDPRARECTGIAFSALITAQKIITGAGFGEDFERIANWFVEHGRVSASELEKDVFRLRWISDCVNLVTSGIDSHAKNFIQVRRGGIGPDGKVNILKGNQNDILRREEGKLLILIAPNELNAAYQREMNRRKETMPIDVRNIRHELKREPCWIPAPKAAPGVHRFTVDGFRPQLWWVMHYENAGDLKEIVSTIYERFLAEHDLELDDAGNVATLGSGDGSVQEPLAPVF